MKMVNTEEFCHYFVCELEILTQLWWWSLRVFPPCLHCYKMRTFWNFRKHGIIMAELYAETTTLAKIETRMKLTI